MSATRIAAVALGITLISIPLARADNAAENRGLVRLRIEVDAFRPTPEQLAQIDTADDSNVVVALAEEGRPSRRTRRLYAFDAPTLVGETVHWQTGMNVPFKRGTRVDDSGTTNTLIEYEEIGCQLKFQLAWTDEDMNALNIEGRMSIEDMLTDSPIKFSEQLPAPIFAKCSQSLNLSLGLGETVTQTLYSGYLVGGSSASTVLYVVRVSAEDPRKTDSE